MPLPRPTASGRTEATDSPPSAAAASSSSAALPASTLPAVSSKTANFRLLIFDRYSGRKVAGVLHKLAGFTQPLARIAGCPV